MLDIKFIRENTGAVKKAAKEKQMDAGVVDRLLKVDEKRRKLIQEVEKLRRERKAAAEKREVEKGKKIKKELGELETGLRSIETKFKQLMFLIPNIPADDAPRGKDSSANREISHWGEIPKFDFPAKDHIQIGKELDIIDLLAGAKVAGFRGYFLKNEAVLLHFGALMFAFEKIISKGFMPFLPPTILKEFALIGSGHFPFGKEDVYQIANPGKLASGGDVKEPCYLAGTAEPSLLAYFSDQTLSEDELPVKVCGWTQCYRSEVGSYGKDTRGIYRIHEFMKVEQVVLCKNDLGESGAWLEKMRGYSEEILRELKLPYRVVEISTGDMGAGKRKMYDIETWMPSRNNYGETHSDSDLTDWQARRLNIKYKTKKGETQHVYALNNTVLASPRILIAILENYQQKDGSVVVPEVLRKWVGKDRIAASS